MKTTPGHKHRIIGPARAAILEGMPDEDPAPVAKSSTDDDDLARALRTIARAASDLRTAGVLRVGARLPSGGEVSFDLMPWAPPPPAGAGDEEERPRTTLHDAALYPGGRVPTLERPPPRRPSGEEPYDGDES